MSIEDRLNERLESEIAVDTNDQWQIDNMDLAAWASRKLAALYNELEKVRQWEDRETARIIQATLPEKKRLNKDIEFFETHLGDYLRRLVHEGRKTKSIQLPGGKVTIRSRQPKLSIPFQDQLEQWAKQNAPETIVTTEEINMSKFKARLEYVEGGIVIDKTTGEMLPVTWYVEPDKASFTPEKEDVA